MDAFEIFSKRLNTKEVIMRTDFSSLVQLDGEITQGSLCTFSCIHCLVFIARDVAFVARLLYCRHLELSPSQPP